MNPNKQEFTTDSIVNNTLSVENNEKQDDMLLPKGLTCKDCFHSNRCSTLFGGDDSNISCQFSPSRFRPA